MAKISPNLTTTINPRIQKRSSMNPKHKKHEENDYTQRLIKIKSLKISDRGNLKSSPNITTRYVEK